MDARTLRHGNSRTVTSNQSGAHPDCARLARLHTRHPYRRPLAPVRRNDIAVLEARIAAADLPVVLDSGCGTGVSTHALARARPDRSVIGIDRSDHRLTRARRLEPCANLAFLRADCVDVWRIAARDAWPVSDHCLFYPNPWPKAKHVRRRWHAHPVFPALVALGGRLELRSNWAIYVREFALALRALGVEDVTAAAFEPDAPCSAFERKYHASGHVLYRLVADLAERRDGTRMAHDTPGARRG